MEEDEGEECEREMKEEEGEECETAYKSSTSTN